MMHASNLVVALKVNGKILRESGDTVTLPFGTEYSVLIKNLNSVRIQSTLAIDGTDATGGTRLVIGPNSAMEIERFIRNGNLQAGNRFQFIERTEVIEQHRGIGADDGIVRVEAWRELVRPHYVYPTVAQRPPFSPHWPQPPQPRRWPLPGRPPIRGPMASAGPSRPSASATQARPAVPRPMHPQSKGASSRVSDAGITVPGRESRQQFAAVHGFALESQSVVISLRLLGMVDNVEIKEPVTVQMKTQCVTCGRSNGSDVDFCPRCGTAARLI